MKLTVMRMFSTTEWYSSSFRNPSNGEKPLQSVTCTTFTFKHHFDTCTDLLLILTQQQEAQHRMHCGHCTPVSLCSCLWLTAFCPLVASNRLACYHEVSAERFRLLPHFCRTNGADLLRDCTSADCSELTTGKHTPSDHCTSGVCFWASLSPAGRKLKVPKLCAQATGYLRLAGHYAARGTMHNGAHLQVAR